MSGANVAPANESGNGHDATEERCVISRHHYECSKEIAAARSREGWPYYALIQAAMRDGDTENRAKLKAAWPDLWDDLWERYDAPGGILSGDPPYLGPGHNSLDARLAAEAVAEGAKQDSAQPEGGTE